MSICTTNPTNGSATVTPNTGNGTGTRDSKKRIEDVHPRCEVTSAEEVRVGKTGEIQICYINLKKDIEAPIIECAVKKKSGFTKFFL